MSSRRRLIISGAIVWVALSTGYVMQRVAPPDHPALTGTTVPGMEDGARFARDTPAPPPVELPAITQRPVNDLRAQTESPLVIASDPPVLITARPDTPVELSPAVFEASRAEAARARAPGQTLAPFSAGFIAGPIFNETDPTSATARAAAASALNPLDLEPLEVAVVTGGENGSADRSAQSEVPPPSAATTDACEPHLSLTAAPAAMIGLDFVAPCDPSSRLTIRHAGLAITGFTDGEGVFRTDLPALATQAQVTLAVNGGPSVSGSVDVPDLDNYDRVAVQWQGNDRFELHAFESGAGYGDEGHVWSGAAHSAERALEGSGGFLTRLGDTRADWPLVAEIYTFPVERLAGSTFVEVQVEAQVAAQTCGREMLGETIDRRSGARARVVDLTLPMPDCSALGGYLVLKNLFPDLTIAGN